MNYHSPSIWQTVRSITRKFQRRKVYTSYQDTICGTDLGVLICSLDYFFNPKFCLNGLLELFFIAFSNNLFMVEIAYSVGPWHIIFYFLDLKDFLRWIRSVVFSMIVRVFWYSHMVTNFEFRIFVIMSNTIVIICTWLNINRSDFDYVLWCVLLHLSTISSGLLLYMFFVTLVMCL